MNLVETLKGKVFGIPVWILVLLATGAAIWYFRRNSQPANAASDTTASGLDTSQLANANPTMGGVSVTVPQTPGTNPVPVTSTGTPPGGTNTPAPPPKVKSISYTVKRGDDLWDLENKFHLPHGTIYRSNSSIIETQARQHGYSSSDKGHWIFPGERIVIPA